MSKILVEATATPKPSGKEGRWSAVLITPGKGSSGTYSESVLKETGPTALRKGAKSFVTHNRTASGEADPFAMWGVLAEDAKYVDGVGLVGEIEVLPSWRDRVAEVAPHTALSIYVMGEADEDGNVTALLEDVQNGVDMVVYPGRPGSGLVEKLYESAVADSDKPSAASVVETNDEKGLSVMAEKDILDKLDGVISALAGLAASKVEKEAAEVDAEAISTAVSAAVEAYAKAEAAIDAAELLPSQVASLKETAKRGEDVTSAIESAKAIAKEAKETFTTGRQEETGRFGESLQVDSAVDLGKVFG